MYFPTIVVDNFYDNLNEVVEYANSLPYGFDGYSMPGVKTEHLSEINQGLFNESAQKALSLIYGDYKRSQVRFSCHTRFERIVPYGDNYDSNGWVHYDDDNILTGILYLDVEPQHGTTLYNRKNIIYKEVMEYKPDALKEVLHSGQNPDPNEYNQALHKWNSKFEESVVVKGKPNRLVLFDSKQWHAENGYGLPNKPRLIQTFFFNRIEASYYPIPEMKRTVV